TTAVRDDVRKALRSSKILFNGLALAQTNDAVTVRIVDPTKTGEAKSILQRVVQPSGLSFGLGNNSSEYDIVTNDTTGQVTMSLSRAGREELRQRTME